MRKKQIVDFTAILENEVNIQKNPRKYLQTNDFKVTFSLNEKFFKSHVKDDVTKIFEKITESIDSVIFSDIVPTPINDNRRFLDVYILRSSVDTDVYNFIVKAFKDKDYFDVTIHLNSNGEEISKHSFIGSIHEFLPFTFLSYGNPNIYSLNKGRISKTIENVEKDNNVKMRMRFIISSIL